jgi:hypothetical protein
MRLEDFFRKAIETGIQYDLQALQIVPNALATKIKGSEAFSPGEKTHQNSSIGNDIAIDNRGLHMLLDNSIQNETSEIMKCYGFRKARHYS